MALSAGVFNHEHPFTIGVEEEYMLCNPESGNLINRADEIMERLPESLKDRFSYELILSEIEINTSVNTTVDGAINEIASLRQFTQELGNKLGFQIGISGTHPTAICKEQSFVRNESYNWVADQLNFYARRNVTFALHIHIAVPNKDAAIHISNALRRWIAPLLALSTNSPYFEGEFTGIRSSRTFQFGIFPRTNIPVMFDNFEKYQQIVENYLNTKTIEKPRQIWWKLRPHFDYGTIEFRISDVQRSLKKVEMFVALAQALVYQANEEYEKGTLSESFNLEYLNDALWKAARFPFDKQLIDPLTIEISTMTDQIKKMAAYSEKALLHFNTAHVLDEVDMILRNGTEGDDQKRIHDKYGMKDLKLFLMKNVDYTLN